jgi:hypothetical protein
MKRTLVVAILLALCPSASLARPQKRQISWFKVVGRVLDGNGRPIHWGTGICEGYPCTFSKN